MYPSVVAIASGVGLDALDRRTLHALPRDAAVAQRAEVHHHRGGRVLEKPRPGQAQVLAQQDRALVVGDLGEQRANRIGRLRGLRARA
jgi:hypothetical protein